MTATKTFTDGEHTFTFRASAMPTMRTDRLLDYLSSVGYSDADLTKYLKPALQRWAEPAEILNILKTNGFKAEVKPLEKLLQGLFCTRVRAWYEQVTAGDDEGTPERDLADEADYWSAYAPTFGKAVYRLRAIRHNGEILFMADDVAKMYGGVYASVPVGNFVSEVVVVCMKKHAIKKLTYREVLSACPSAEADKASMKRGKWFMDRRTMLRVLAKSSKPSADEFVNHLIDVLDGKAETLETFKERKVKMRSEARATQLKTYPSWDANNRAHGASTIRSNGEVFYHVTKGRYSTQENYCAKHGIERPFAENLPEDIVQKTNLVREVTVTLADKHRVKGQHHYDETIARAAGIAAIVRENPEAVEAMAAAAGLACKPRHLRNR